MTHELMSDERLAKLGLLAKNDLLLEEVLADYKRLRGELFALRGLAKGRAQGPPDLICNGCGQSPTSTADADGVHLCRDCGMALVESES